MDLKSLLNVLPGGPKAVHVYGKALFPPIADFSVIEEAATQGLFPTIGAIFYPALFYAAVFGILRTVLTRFIFRPLAIYSRQLKPSPKVFDACIEKELVTLAARTNKRVGATIKAQGGKPPAGFDPKKPTREQITAFCTSNSAYSEIEVQKYLWRKRRHVNTELKITKFVEAIWRFTFYSVFCVIGYIGIFRNPTPVCWAGDMTMCYRGWPFLESHQLLSDLLKWYYQIELGCYVHQLMWTEVGRKDSTEMIIHHVATIFLVMWSWCANLTRIGTVTMFLHDLSDIFLESAKCINYASLSKGRKWLSSYCDGTFAVFAITFFVTRLYYFPRYCVFGFIFDAPRAFNDRTDWYGYKIFGALLTTLQVLHIFWFYLIAKMIYGLMKKGEVEGDVRSDAEDEDDTWTPEKDDGKKGK